MDGRARNRAFQFTALSPGVILEHSRSRRRSPSVRASLSLRALGLIAATLSNPMNSAAEMILLVFVLAPVVLIGVIFVWGARKDGQEDRAVQA
jgi:hypothetical protein